jgi:truncated hemoglobin YjbI
MEKSVKYGSLANARKLAPVNPGAFVGNASLFSRLGGEAVLADLVRDFYGQAINNEHLKKFFDTAAGNAKDEQLQRYIAFLTASFGGPNTGVDVRITTKLIALGVGNAQFDAVAEILASVLKNKGIESTVADEVLAFNEKVRKNVMR